ncbi:MAG: glycosyltransferase family 2 protein [Hespellia sp.]|jgi:glycosyltransferase involved in cell wall biosynthesis|nr:glycosyltransferase family 2 protein [Hespellia sp.]
MHFSVIVSVYKVAPYLRVCVDSILSQTFRDFELILVDDGSPDQCPAICDAYAEKDPRVTVIHQPNGGPARARKTGLLASTGEYIVFVDGDDWIAATFLEQGAVLLKKTQAELILFSCSFEYETRSEIIREPVAEGLYDRTAIESNLYGSLLMNRQMKHLLYFIPNKVFRRSLAEEGILAVKESISLGEDLLGVLPVFLRAKEICVSSRTMYFYRIKEQSGSHGFQMKHFYQVSMALKELQKISFEYADCLPKDFEEQIARYGAYMCFTLMIHAVNDGKYYRLREICQQLNRPLFRECIQQAQFEDISPKTRITYWLLRKGRVRSAYMFLSICRRIRRNLLR